VYIQILSGRRKVPASFIIKNITSLTVAKLRGSRRASAHLEAAAAHKQFSPDGVVIARIDFNRGRLLALRRERAQARACFEQARSVAHAQGLEALRQSSEAALAQLA
jgi:hypothetical protein